MVDILEVSQGATVFQEGADWQQSGNYVDWLGSGNEPAIGTTYTVRWTYTKQMIKGTDYVDGGWFGRSGHPAADEYFYLVTVQSATGETQYDPAKVVSRDTLAGEINRLSWLPVSGATGYRIYRGTQNTVRSDFQRLKDVASGVTSYIDDGADEIVGGNPPASNTSGLTMSPVQVEPGNLSIINFGRTNIGDEPVAASNCSIDYDYYIGRKDIIYATTREIKRLEGAPADWPKLPIVPEGTLGLCSVDCPPNSVDLTVFNFGLTRITMDQIHEIIKDVEDLKYNDAQFQMNNELQNRDAQTKKGVYSDDFSNNAQSDIYHAEWDARIERDPPFRRAGPHSAAHCALGRSRGQQRQLFKGSLALLPGNGTCADRTERLVRGQATSTPTRCSTNPTAIAGDHPQHRQARADRDRRGRVELSIQREQRDHPLRRPGDGQQPDQRRGRSGQRLLHHSDQRPQRQPHRGDGRRRLLGPGQPSDQRSDDHHPHRTHHRETHHPRACGAGGLAHRRSSSCAAIRWPRRSASPKTR